jgi:putative ABC transport system permease protein
MVSKPLNLILSLMLLLLSVSLVTFALQMSQQVDQQLNKNIAPFDMVVGAKGSPLQLVLASVLHIDNPTGNIKMKEASLVERNPLVQTAIPISYGDNYKGYRILGTEVEYLDFYNAELKEGKLFEKSFEAVAGSGVARKLGLKVGDTFLSSHGLAEDGHAHDEHPYTVVGILNPTGTVVDQLLIANLESIWDAHGHADHEDHDDHEHEEEHDHDHEGHDHDDHEGHDHGDEHDHDDHEGHDHGKHEIDENTEITSLLVKFKSPLGMVQIPRSINENTNMQAALPGFEINRLMNLLGSGVQTINWIALVILLVSGLSIFISLLKTIRERKQELALLRTYGLNTGQLLTLALLEGSFLAVIGFVLGWLLGRLGIVGVSGYMESSYGYGLQVSGPDMTELILLVLIFAVAIVASLLASLSIFKLDVAKTLSDA